jgi:hypothetical protein
MAKIKHLPENERPREKLLEKGEKYLWSIKLGKLEKTAINNQRLIWCLESFDLSLEELAEGINVSLKTLISAREGDEALTIGQLKKLSEYSRANCTTCPVE